MTYTVSGGALNSTQSNQALRTYILGNRDVYILLSPLDAPLQTCVCCCAADCVLYLSTIEKEKSKNSSFVLFVRLAVIFVYRISFGDVACLL